MKPPPDWQTGLAAFPASVRTLLDGIRPAGGRLTADQTTQVLAATGGTVESLMTGLLPLAACYAVPPVSDFHVGAVVAGPGEAPALYFGANYEVTGGALNFSIHAEQAAVNHAWLAGETADTRLAVTAAPCGHCRQFLQELPDAGGVRVLVPGQTARPLADLLPQPFGPDALEIGERLLPPDRRPLALAVANDDPVVLAAREAAESSHAPYSRSPAGCALQVEGGRIQTGRSAESAAYNPTLPALASAVSALILRDRPAAVKRITRAVLVERAQGPASQRTLSAALLECCAPGVKLDYFKAR